MLAQVHSFVLQGIEPLACEAEGDVADPGLPRTTIVGLPDRTTKDQKAQGVKSAYWIDALLLASE